MTLMCDASTTLDGFNGPVRLECFLGWKGLHTLNMLLNCCGTTLSETGTLSQETPNPDFLFPCRGRAQLGVGGQL